MARTSLPLLPLLPLQMASGSGSGIIGMSGGAYVTDWSPTHDPAAGVPPHPLHRSVGRSHSSS